MVYQISNDILVKNNFNYIKDVYEVCLNRYLQHPQNLSNALKYINNGRKILTSEKEVDTYISLYGAHHYYKLIEAFDALNLNRFNNTCIETISYGCGAATDTCSLISYCYTKNINLLVNNITLIEPSFTALERGVKYIQQSLSYQIFDRLNIKKIYKLIEKLEDNDLTSNSEAIKIHIFSNILDINSIDLLSLASVIHKTQKGSNYFICINPKNLESKSRIDCFYNILSSHFKLIDIDINDRDIIGKPIWMMKYNRYTVRSPIYRYHRIFKADAM